MGKVSQYGAPESIENVKFLGTDGNQTVNVPYGNIKEQMFGGATATADKNGLMSKEDKAKLDGMPASFVTGMKGSAESAYRKGNVNITPANIGLGNVNNTSDANKPVSTAQQAALNAKVGKGGDVMTGHLQMGTDTMENSPNVYWRDKNRSIWAGTANGSGNFYLWDATNNKRIISSATEGTNVFEGAAREVDGTSVKVLDNSSGGVVKIYPSAAEGGYWSIDAYNGALRIYNHDAQNINHFPFALVPDGIKLSDTQSVKRSVTNVGGLRGAITCNASGRVMLDTVNKIISARALVRIQNGSADSQVLLPELQTGASTKGIYLADIGNIGMSGATKTLPFVIKVVGSTQSKDNFFVNQAIVAKNGDIGIQTSGNLTIPGNGTVYCMFDIFDYYGDW